MGKAWIQIGNETKTVEAKVSGCPLSSPEHSLREALSSPLLALIEAIDRTYPETARLHLRRRMWIDYPIRAYERALVKVAAKRVTDQASHPEGGVSISIPDGEPSSDSIYTRDRLITAEALNARGEVIAQAKNQASVSRCRHAEMNLLRELTEAVTEIRVSLKPCKMCAAFLMVAWHDARKANRPFRVVYLEEDPGPLARETALDARSAGRKEFLRDLFPGKSDAWIVKQSEYAEEIQYYSGITSSSSGAVTDG